MSTDTVDITMRLQQAAKFQKDAIANSRAVDTVDRSTQRAGTSMKKANTSSSRFADGLQRMRRGFAGVSTGAKIGLTAIAAFGGYQIKQSITQTTDMMKAMLGFSRVTGESVQSSAQWVEIAKLRKTELRSLQMGMVQLSKNTLLGTKHGTAQNKLFRQLGLSMDFVKRASPTQMFGAISDKLKGVHNITTRSAIGAQLFGRSYLKLSAVIAGGTKGLKENMDMTKGVGDAMGHMSRAEMVQYIKNSFTAQANMDALRITIGMKLLPTIDKLVKSFTKVVEWFIKHKTVTDILLGAIIAITVAIVALNVVTAVLAVIAIGTAGLIVIAVVAVIAILVALYAKVRWFRNAVNTAISFIVKHWKLAVALLLSFTVGPITALVFFVVTHFRQIVNFVKSLPGKIGKAAKGMFNGIKEAFRDAINFVIRGWNSLHLTIGPIKIPMAPDIPKFTVSVPQIPLLAAGGIVSGLGSWITGDAGPEVNTLMPGGRVKVEPLTGGPALAGAGGGTYEIHVHSHLNGREIAHDVARVTADEAARRGR